LETVTVDLKALKRNRSKPKDVMLYLKGRYLASDDPSRPAQQKIGKRGKTRGTGMIIRFPRRHESDSLRACRLPTSMAFHTPI
jgi:hypothetical protein